MTSTTSAPPLREQEERRRQLRVMKARATGLLVVTAALLMVVHVVGHGRGWLAYVEAAAEASMVGGLADWFAVTALFRHPLGLPIPHTAVIRERKDQFGRTLGSFVEENFLTPDVLLARLRGAHVVDRVAAWAADPANAAAVAERAADLVVTLSEAVKDEDVHRMANEAMTSALERVPVASLAGRTLRAMTAQGRHQELLDAMLVGLERVLAESEGSLRDRFSTEAPWWLPGAVEDRIFDRLLDGFRTLLHDVNSDPAHEIRKRFDERVADFVDRLEQSPELAERGEQLKRELLGQPELRRWSSSLWSDVKRALREQAEQPESELRRRLATAVAMAGDKLRDDPELAAKAEQLTESAVAAVIERFHGEIGDLVTATISRWDGEETADKLELLLGPDLQFIRINGTVVGGLAGLLIYTLLHAF